jgi:hypothetical protein
VLPVERQHNLVVDIGDRPALPAVVEPVENPFYNNGIGMFRAADHLWWIDLMELIALADDYGPMSMADYDDLRRAMVLIRSFPSVRAHKPLDADPSWYMGPVMHARREWSRSSSPRTGEEEGRQIMRWSDTIREIVTQPTAVLPPVVVGPPAQEPVDEPPWWSAEEEIEWRRFQAAQAEIQDGNPEQVWEDLVRLRRQENPEEDLGEEVW